MKLSRKVIADHSDWVALAAIVLSILAVALGVTLYLDSKPSSGRSRPAAPRYYAAEMYETVLPDPRYPAPAKEQRTFYQTYHVGNFSYNLVWSNRNVERSANIGAHSFILEIYNSRNALIAATSEETRAMAIGCIAADDPYRFTPVEVKPLGNFEPYEHKKIEFGIDVACRYLGTADGQYFWRIY